MTQKKNFSANRMIRGLNEGCEISKVRNFSKVCGCKTDNEPVWHEIELRPGLRVSSFEGVLTRKFSFSYQKKNQYIDFGFFLKGSLLNRIAETPLGPLLVLNDAGFGGLGFLNEMSGSVRTEKMGRVRNVHLHISPELLHNLLDADMDIVHDDLKLLLENKGDHNFFLNQTMDPVVQVAANELFYGLTTANCNRLYLEGKALELIGLQITKFEPSSRKYRYVLTPREMGKVRAIWEQLKGNYVSPPSMAELSRTHMISISKIQSGFQDLYGMTPFAFLKDYKLSEAKKMFQEGDMNVSEVAWELGYTNLSHFSAAFRRKYGVLPKQFLLSARNKKKPVTLKTYPFP